MIKTLTALRPKKRLFLGLLMASEFLVVLMLYGLWRICYPGLENIFAYLPALVGALLIVVAAVAIGAAGNLISASSGV